MASFHVFRLKYCGYVFQKYKAVFSVNNDQCPEFSSYGN
jgi:hypothetical protein